MNYTENISEKLSLIIPCCNEQESLPLFYAETTAVLAETGCAYELIFVDDGSIDQTLSVIKNLAAEDPRICYLSFSRNFGKEAAIYAGLCSAWGDCAAIMDADLQDPPSLLPKMLEAVKSGGYDSAAARRTDRSGEPRIRSLFSRMFYRIIRRISETDIADGARDFRLMNRNMINAVVQMGEYNRFSKGIFGWVGFRTCWISYENTPRAAGSTKWNFRKLVRYGLDGILNFSNAPLHLSSWFGIGMTALSILLSAFIVLRRICFGDPTAGWASLICVIIFMGGLQLFCIGIMGQYISKIYLESKHRPHYIIAETNREYVKN